MMDNTLKVAVNLLQDGTSESVIKKFLNVEDEFILKAKQAFMKKKEMLLTYEEFKELAKKVKATFSFFPEYKFSYTLRETDVFIASTSMEVLQFFDRHSSGRMTENGYILKLKQTK